MRASPLSAVAGISLFLAPLSYAQHGGAHMGGGFSGRVALSGHSSGRGASSHSSSRFVPGLRHIVPISGLRSSPKSTAPSTDSLRSAADGLVKAQNSVHSQFASGPASRVVRDDPPRRPIIGTRPSPPPHLRRPPFPNPCFGSAFCAGFGFGFRSPLLCEAFSGFGSCFPFFGPTLSFQGGFLLTGTDAGDETSSAGDFADLSSTPASSSTDGAERNHPITLLQLKNGWMYGLADYWVEGDSLHYVTNYGGKNSVPLDLVDLGTTIQLNRERGVEFSLHTKRQSTAQ
jgi:hypothetical protein